MASLSLLVGHEDFLLYQGSDRNERIKVADCHGCEEEDVKHFTNTGKSNVCFTWVKLSLRQATILLCPSFVTVLAIAEGYAGRKG